MNFYNEIKSGLNFQDVAREYGIEFNRSNKSLCPFHDENTPSFHCYDDRGICYGCGKSVDVIDLEAHFKNLSPYAAARSLADRYNIHIPEFKPADKEKLNKQAEAYQTLERFAKSANKNLENHTDVIEFLKQKGLNERDIDKWQIGYIGSDNPVTNNIEDLELAREIGLVNEKGDYFKNRIIIPIWNYGKIIFLMGRAFPDSNPKYLHLKNSELLKKPLAFVENLNKEKCVITEGVFDALPFLEAEFPACALLGTHPGESGKEKLLRAKGKLYFCMDADEAGTEAAYKLAKEYKGYVIELDQSIDSDEIFAEIGLVKFTALVKESIVDADYYLDLVIEREPVVEVLREIAKLEMASEQDVYLNKLAKKNKNMTIRSLRKDLNIINEKTEKAISSKFEDLLTDPKPNLHPAMDLFDGKLIYGHYNGKNPLYISNQKILDSSVILSNFSISIDPQRLRFSSKAIKTYLSGAEMNGPKLLNKISDLLSQYVIFGTSWQPAILALWIVGTYLYRAFPLYPYLWIQSPTKRCGKTRLLELISELAFNSDGIQTAPTEAVLYRVPAITGGTLCWDECEDLYTNREKGERIGILNAAYRKGTRIPRCDGEDNKVIFFEVYRPIALAGISSLPDTVADRALRIELIRKRTDDKVDRLQTDRIQDKLQSFRNDLHIFALERTPVIVNLYNEFRDDLIPEYVDDRLRDALEIIYSIAGGLFCYEKDHNWQTVLNEAAKTLSGIRESEEDDIYFIRAVRILKEQFSEDWGNYKILTSKDAAEIFSNGGLDWVTEPKHARSILRRLGIRSGPHRVNNKPTRGYRVERAKVDDLIKRYGEGLVYATAAS